MFTYLSKIIKRKRERRMATKPTVKKQKNGNLTRNGKPKIKSLALEQVRELIKRGAQKNVTSKLGKVVAKLCRQESALCLRKEKQLKSN